MTEEDYCDCDSYDAASPEFCNITYPKAKKPHRCDECHGPIFVGEKYRRLAGKWEGEFMVLCECPACSELRQWAEISKPCFCAYEIGSLHERVKLMVADIAPIVEGFQGEYDQRAAIFAERKTRAAENTGR
jgi:hypothetical protein